jgi:hypothetical protein
MKSAAAGFPRPLAYGLAIFSVIAVQVLALRAMGHPWICACGHIALWYPDPAGPETSQQLIDWYTPTHFIHGFGFYALLWLLAPKTTYTTRLMMVVGMEAAWEIIENTPVIIDRYRQTALARGYFGDSVINSLSDVLATFIGAVVARWSPVWISIAIVIATEAFLAYAIRDNLTLNIIQLIAPSDFVSRWQSAG